MNTRKFLIFISLLLTAAVLCWGVGQAVAQSETQKKRLDAQDLLEKAMEARHKIDPKFPAKLPEYQITPQPQVGEVGYNWNVNYDLPNWAYSPNIRKFVDKLPGLGAANANVLGQYIPVAVADTTTFPGSDYYEINLNYYVEQLHPDLPAPGTKLRGYAQVNGPDTSNRYLGPLIIAKSYNPRYPAGDLVTGNGKPVRLKFRNNLPVSGSALPGELLPMPVDTTLMGAGTGPLGGAEFYTQNRSTIHLHGGATPWISDGTPHQWLTPAADPTSYKKGLSFQNVPDMITGGTSPCAATVGGICFAPAPGDGLATYYYTNQQSGRLMFYHDHAFGITRLNVYDGIAAGYLLYDQVEQDLIEGTNLSGVFTDIGIAPVADVIPDPLGGVYEFGIPLVIQDRTFVNDPSGTYGPATPPGVGFTGTATAATDVVDPLWFAYVPGTTGGDFWAPHEYIPNEDIYKPSGFNPMGRFDYSPWLAPPLPANNIALPSPSTVPEAMMDTMLVNGHPYPYLEVPRTAIRFRALNAGNDRHLNLQLYYAVDSVTGVVCKGGNVFTAANCTEPRMVSATKNPELLVPTKPFCTDPPPFIDAVTGLPYNAAPGDCTPTTWPVDGRVGGVPDPSTAGPKFIQIGSEGGLLPQVAIVPSNPTNFDYSRRSVTVLGISDKGLWIGGAERADFILDFAAIPAGSYLILYNDAPSPTPLFDPRTDIFVGQDDLTADGGTPPITPGYGPNTRTIMQFRVIAGPAVVFDLARLEGALPKAYAKSQPRPVVPETAYNLAFPGTATVDDYANVTTESLNITGLTEPVGRIVNGGGGIGYTVPPNIIFAGGGGTGATATACLNGVTAITVTASGAGYVTPPAVSFVGGGGTGATAIATILGGAISGITIVDPGCNYTIAPTITLTGGGFTTPATAVGAVTPGSVGTITLTNGGSGYIKSPLVFVVSANGLGTGALADAILAGAVALRQVNITEGFEIWYGRGNVILGTTPVPLLPLAPIPAVPAAAAYIDPPSDFLDVNEPQYWRISHIGVDMHPLHFHFINVQIVNRVDWTNSILPPDANELGWKETVRTIPFTDMIIAFRPQAIKLPFRLPTSNRLLDPTQPLGSTANFPVVVPVPGAPAPAPITNITTNFGHEFVFHCHMLSHEENDMMRPLVVNPFNSKVGTFSGVTWNLQKPYPTNSLTYASFGQAGDIPITGDWTGDGITKIGVFRTSGGIGRFYLDLNGNGIWDGLAVDKAYLNFGVAGDTPVTGDWDGTGKTKIGVFRIVGGVGRFYLDKNGDGTWNGTPTDIFYSTFGQTGDIPVTGDWTGNGITRVGVFRVVAGVGRFYRDTNASGTMDGGDANFLNFGQTGDLPVTGDWNGDGITKVGLYRVVAGVGRFYLDMNNNGTYLAPPDQLVNPFGVAGAKPISGKW